MTVLYCLVQTDTPAALPSGGLPGARPPRAISLPDGLTAVVATLPDGEYSPDAVSEKLRDMNWVSQAALGHEQLLEAAMRSSRALLPMKLLTLFSGDEPMVKALAQQRTRLARAAAHVADCEEYGLRLVALDAPAETAGTTPASSGTAFLERKKQVRDAARERAAARTRFAREAHETLAAACRDAVARPVEDDDVERPLLDAAFLVAGTEKGAFGRAADRLGAAAAAAHCTFKLTGPWPPYHFVQVDRAS
ncbi:MAG: GvpL/GvpF family gas vesicle protein [Vicinamibacterales bacterium]